VRMIERGRRQPLDVMNALLREFGEPPITQDDWRKYTERQP